MKKVDENKVREAKNKVLVNFEENMLGKKSAQLN